MNKILIINGANLNMLGTREPGIYGKSTLVDLERSCIEKAKELNLEAICFQSNIEGDIINKIHSVNKDYKGVIINAGGYSHSSVAIRDALACLSIPIYEVHISNVFAREEFRHFSYISSIAKGVICGFGIQGYLYAIEYISNN